jgi:hypothetical protein
LPAWARVTYTAPADILIIDNDASASLAFPDYAGYYTETLETLGYTYNVLDVDAQAGAAANFLDAVDLMAYKAVIYYTGDNYYRNGAFTDPTPLTVVDMYTLNEYANQGGTLIAMGQDLAWVWNATVPANAPFTYAFTLGGKYLSDSVNNGVISPTFEITGTGALPMAGITLDLSETGDGAANQYFVDEIASHVPLTNQASIDPDYVAILRYPDDSNLDDGAVGMAHREQPTLEKPGVAYDGRSIYTGFGLEGVNNTSDYATREDLLQQALEWGWDNPTAALTSTAVNQDSTFTASLESNIAGVTGFNYRWDFGDGTAFTTASPEASITHKYARPGTYTVRVEVVDSLGNHAIGTQVVKVQQNLYIPLVRKPKTT